MDSVSQANANPKQSFYKSVALQSLATGAVGAAVNGVITARENNANKKLIQKAEAACDEVLIRKHLKDFWKGQVKEGETFFESAVKDSINFAKRNLESVKEWHKIVPVWKGMLKGAAFFAAITAGLNVLFKLSLGSVKKSDVNKQV